MQPALLSKGSLNTNANQGGFKMPTYSNIGKGLTLPNTNPKVNSGVINNNVPVTTQVTQGTNGGFFPPPVTPPKPDTTYTHTTTTNGNGGTSTKATPIPSVLKQQQDLNIANKTTQGYTPLIEDGLAGPKTQAALTQYGSPKATTNTSENSTTSGVLPKSETPTSPTPAPLTTGGQAPGVIGTGNQTQNEIDTQKRLMEVLNISKPMIIILNYLTNITKI